MKLLVDENLPKRLKEGFNVLLTFDKNIQYQQNFEKYPISVLVLNAEDNAYQTLKPLVPQIRKLLTKDH